ncbi:unnamed protein product [Arabidopsis halleri]
MTLIENGLRERVILRVDGGLKSGVDVLMAAAMGADEYGCVLLLVLVAYWFVFLGFIVYFGLHL